MRPATFAAAAAIPLALALADVAGAVSCREQLADFERRLHDSSLAADDPDTYAELARQAEEASELRDEELCLQRVAELDDALPADEPASPQPTDVTSSAPAPAPPAAPLLLDPAPVDYEADSTAEGPEDVSENGNRGD